MDVALKRISNLVLLCVLFKIVGDERGRKRIEDERERDKELND